MRSRMRVWIFMVAVAGVAVVVSWLLKDSQKVFAPDILQVKSTSALPGRPIIGERLVRPDGTISLGYYGSVYVAGLTRREIRQVVARQLRRSVSGVSSEDISVSVVPRRPNIIDWLTGKARLNQVRSLF